MQPFESTNDYFPLNAGFYPPATDTGFASVASSSFPEPIVVPSSELDQLDSINYEASSFPSYTQQYYPYPNNFLPLQGFSMVALVTSPSIPELVDFPSELDLFDEAMTFLSNPQQHNPSNNYPNNFLPLQGFSTDASAVSSSIPKPVVVPSAIDINGINDEASSFPQHHYPSVYPNNLMPLQGFSKDNHIAHPEQVTISDNSHEGHPPETKPSVRKTRVQNRKRLGEEGRIKYLQNDEYILSFRETWVTCAGCRKRIKLDSRNGARYYPGFWLKHKKRCPGVEIKW